jgi:hypothetical protein
MKKKYVLSTLVSLALGSGYALAEGASPSEVPVWTPPTVEQPSTQEFTTPPPAPELTLPSVTQPRDSGKSFQEMMEKRRVLWQEIQVLRGKISQTWDPEKRQRLVEELRQKMPQRGGMPGGPYGMGPQPGFGGPMGAPPQGPRYDMPPRFNEHQYFCPKGKKDCGHHPKMLERLENRLENIENLLKQVVDLLKDKRD